MLKDDYISQPVYVPGYGYYQYTSTVLFTDTLTDSPDAISSWYRQQLLWPSKKGGSLIGSYAGLSTYNLKHLFPVVLKQKSLGSILQQILILPVEPE